MTCQVIIDGGRANVAHAASQSPQSELVQMGSYAPQEITAHGRPVAVVLAKREFGHIAAWQASLLSFMQSSLLQDLSDTAFERDSSLARDIAL